MSNSIGEHWKNARKAWEKGSLLQAVQLYEELIRAVPNEPQFHFELAKLFLSQQCPRQAELCLRAILALDPNHFKAHLEMGYALLLKGDPEGASRFYKVALNIQPNDIDAHLGQIALLNIKGQWQDVLDFIEIAETKCGPHIEWDIARASVYQNLRQYKKGRDLILPYIKNNVLSAPLANAYIKLCIGLKEYKEPMPFIKYILEAPEVSLLKKRPLFFALGRIHVQLGNAKEAMRYFHLGNQLKPRNFDPKGFQSRLEKVETFFSPAILTSSKREPIQKLTPIFIVGMPRSGSSLTEQILASHPQVTALGELPFLGQVLNRKVQGKPLTSEWIKSLSPDELSSWAQDYLDLIPPVSTPYFTDKLPANFELLGWIQLLFPYAKIIHTTRHPLDIALSCYMQNFNYVEFSNDLEHIGHYYVAYHRLMTYWKAHLFLPVLDFSYDSLVQSQELESRQLLDFCGLEWNPECLTFFNNSQETNTVSSAQVKQPLYTFACGRYRDYLKDLEPVIDILNQAQINMDLVSSDKEIAPPSL